MGKLLSFLIWTPLALAFAILLAANRQLVAISFDPTSVENPALQTMAIPLWMWLILCLLVGFFLGATAMWSSGRAKRIEAAANRRAVKDLQKENQILAARTTGDAPLIVAE
ncbi:MAG: LapA family protein [Pseudomonadota bacterium]